MAVIKPQEIQTEEERHAVVEESILLDVPSFPGRKCVRDITPLVMTALHRANNPYVTGKKGFASIGVQFGENGEQQTSPLDFAILMMPKTAEVLLLLSCTREELKAFARVPGALEDAALDIVEDSSMDAMAAATVFISERLKAISGSRVAASPDDDKPAASTLEDTGPKEPAPTG